MPKTTVTASLSTDATGAKCATSAITDHTPKVYLSERNLRALLSKLERDRAGDHTDGSIVKFQQPSASYRQTMDSVMVIAVQDEDYYGAQARAAGEMHPNDEKWLAAPSTGLAMGSSIW